MTGFGYDPTHSIVKARQEGLQTVLYKPFRADRLMEAVEQALRPKGPSADGQASVASGSASGSSTEGRRIRNAVRFFGLACPDAGLLLGPGSLPQSPVAPPRPISNP